MQKKRVPVGDLPRIAALHHERQDGSGYPKKLRGNEIGMLGSIAAIVDTFGAMTVRWLHADPLSPSPMASADEPYRILDTLEFGSVPFDPEELFMK